MKSIIPYSFIVILLFTAQACSIPASCENADYVGEWSGTSECDGVSADEITVFIDDANGELSLSYYNNSFDAIIEDCFIKAEGSVIGGYIKISGTELLGLLSLNIEEDYGSIGVNNCTANLRK